LTVLGLPRGIEVKTMTESTNDKPPALFSSHPTALLALLAAGTGVIALASIGVELLTDQSLAQSAQLGVSFVSLPLGVATIVLAALTARANIKWSLPALAFGLAYWAIFLIF
jgi:hypothetical protein